jgi:hypothetical protein
MCIGIVSCIVNPYATWRWVHASDILLLGKELPLPIGQQAGRSPDVLEKGNTPEDSDLLVWHCVIWWVATDIKQLKKNLGLFATEEEGITVVWNVGNCLYSDTALFPRRLDLQQHLSELQNIAGRSLLMLRLLHGLSQLWNYVLKCIVA